MEKKRKRVSLGATPKKGSTSTSNKRGASGKTKKNGLSGNGEESSVHQGSVYRNKKGAVANNNNNNSSRWNVNEDRETFSVGNANPNIQRCMSSVIECNGIRAYNNLKLSVTASNVIEVTSYNSVMVPSTPGSSGGGRGSKHLDSSLVLALIEKIEMFGQNSTVVGCVAWLSHPLILEALKKCRRVLIVVNREDYTVWGNGKCLQYYKQLPDFDQPISVAFEHLNTILNTLEPGRKAGKSSFASIRAYGATNSLEHNKWLIFFESRFVTFRMLCDDSHSIQRFVDRYGLCLALKKRLQKDNLDLNDGAWFEFPCAYWTGSMNFTKRSESHHESAEFIVNDDLAFNKFLDFSATFMNSTSVASTSRSATPANKGKMNVI